MSNHARVAFIAGILCIASCRDRQKSSADSAQASPTKPTDSASAPVGTNPTAASSARSAFASKLTPAELKWGASVVPDSRVTYQPNVLVLPHGADAVRAMGSNGFTWTIDSNAEGAKDIKIGKILFATGRVVGRVLAMSNSGAELSVTLGPVEITDVIKECNITTDIPVDLSQALAYAAPKYPGAVVDQPHEAQDRTPPANDQIEAVHYSSLSRSSPFTSVSQYASFHGAPSLQETSPIAGFPLDIGSFKQIAFCCGGLGIKLLHDGDDAKISAYAVIHLDNPSLHFNLFISGGQVKTAEVTLNGAAGLTVHFEAATAVGASGNIDKVFFVPVDLSLPISGFGVPFAVTFRQTMVLTTAFTAQNGVISATGDYSFGGSFSMGFHDGGWGVAGPSSFTPKQKLLSGIGGASLGVNGLTFAYGGKVMVGIGAFGFVTGPYFGYNTTVGTVMGSSMTVAGSPPCRRAILDITMRVGVGYMIPQVVTNAINFILTSLNLKTIPSSAGLAHSETLITQNDVFPAGCGQ